jgi:hypothetical protein
MKRDDEPMKRIELGKHVVADPKICDGKLAFNGLEKLCKSVRQRSDPGN